MLHTKPQSHLHFGSRVEDFKGFYTIYGRGGYLGQMTQMRLANFRSP